MKHPISMILCCLVLAACNDMITRWWNSGPYMHISAKEKKAEDECFEELRYLSPTPEQKNDPKLYEEWRAKVYIPKDIECMRRKGY